MRPLFNDHSISIVLHHPIAIVQRPSRRYCSPLQSIDCSMSPRTLRWPGALSIALDLVSVVTAVVGGLSLGSLVRLFETVQCVYLTSGTVLWGARPPGPGPVLEAGGSHSNNTNVGTRTSASGGLWEAKREAGERVMRALRAMRG